MDGAASSHARPATAAPGCPVPLLACPCCHRRIVGRTRSPWRGPVPAAAGARKKASALVLGMRSPARIVCGKAVPPDTRPQARPRVRGRCGSPWFTIPVPVGALRGSGASRPAGERGQERLMPPRDRRLELVTQEAPRARLRSSTPPGRTRPGSMTTGWAGRTTSRRTGRPPSGRSGTFRGSSPGSRSSGRSWPGRPLPGRPGGHPPVPGHRHRPARREQHPRGGPGDRAGRAGSCTSTTTRWSSRTPARCWPAARTAAPPTSTPTCATPARSSAGAPGHPGLHPAGRGLADRDPAAHRGRGRAARDRPPAAGRRAVRQLAGDRPPG